MDCRNQKGISAILTVLVISSVILLVTVNSLSSGVDFLQVAVNSNENSNTRFLAESCMSEILLRLNMDQDYGLALGDFILDMYNGECKIEITSSNSERWISILAERDNYFKSLKVGLDYLEDKSIKIIDWQEKFN